MKEFSITHEPTPSQEVQRSLFDERIESMRELMMAHRERASADNHEAHEDHDSSKVGSEAVRQAVDPSLSNRWDQLQLAFAAGQGYN